MGVLAKENMLRILGIIFIVSLLLGPVFAGAGFFEGNDTVVQESGCSECKSEAANLNTDLKEKVAAIEKKVSTSFDKKENLYDTYCMIRQLPMAMEFL